ncbi:methylisocitrate lyase [Streptomyces sp. NPDC057697]|uniref:methylisocitrate lyase n=1 Tax=Streptomyces sp. NPDC057697 TaxID=3346219 RepID=UPI0036AB66D9
MVLHTRTTPAGRRRTFREQLASGRLLRMPGAINPLSARLIQDTGFDAVYLSGAVLAADLGLPDIGLTTSTEIAARAQQTTRATDLPVLIDADTGFGEPMNAARTVQLLEDAGLAGLHLEDQVAPKRCGHLDGKTLAPREEMVRRLRGAVDARRDPDFLLMARTDARSVEGLDAAIDRAKAYVDAGADAIFPEALTDAAEYEAFRKAVDVPLLANLTEFGKTPLLGTATLEDLGYNIALYPVTLLRIAMGAVEEGLRTLAAEGTQESLLPRMQTRARLYELLGYEEYTAFDSTVFDFTLPPGNRPGTRPTEAGTS